MNIIAFFTIFAMSNQENHENNWLFHYFAILNRESNENHCLVHYFCCVENNNSEKGNDFHDFYYVEANQTFFTSNDNSIYKSTTGDVGDWTNIGRGNPGFPSNVNQIEFAV